MEISVSSSWGEGLISGPHRVKTQLSVDAGQLTNKYGKARAVPPAIVGKFSPNLRVSCGWTVHPDGDDEGKVGQNMDREGKVLPEMEHLVTKDVPTEGDGHCRDDEQSGLVPGKRVGFVVDRNERLNESSDQEDTDRITGLPRHGARPTEEKR